MRVLPFSISLLALTVALATAPAEAARKVRPRPHVVEAPFEKGGHWMNSYYFVRTNRESWKLLSEKLYGRPDRAAMLRKWNGGKRLRIGQIIYYNSPTRPEDSSNLQVFAEDFGYKLEEVVVKKGDSLSRISQQLYGTRGGWKEIAALNPQLQNPDMVEVGDVLKVQPKDIITEPALQRIIKEVAKSEEEFQNKQNGQNIQSPTDPLTENKATPAPAPTPEVPSQVKKSDIPASPTALARPTTPGFAASVKNIGKSGAEDLNAVKDRSVSFKASNFLGLLGAGLLVVSVGIMAGRKLKKMRSSRDDLSKLTNIAPGNHKSPV
ncbi:MAG: LysM peptidoglycan-binding domain-containing protein [Bdellovibrionales bacterium]|nr:LysM peptidoglycan-binding domain-containing protein [Bdellovibrionales bacterium]